MTDQMSWEDLLPTKPQKKQTSPSGAKASSTGETDIDIRISKLMEAKAQKDKLTAQTKKVLAETTAMTVTTGNTSTSIITEQVTVVTTEVKPQEPEVITVSDLNKKIKTLLEKNFPFLWVKGEISNLKIPASGHLYFTLKDSGAQIRAVMFKGFTQSMKFKPEDGMEVLVRCRVTAYEPRGDYQLFCEMMEPVGFGALQVAFEQLKAKLQGEGLFDLGRKRPIPPYPRRIGVITSPTGAAIRDMLNILERRSGGGVDITIIPTSVQGDKAPGEIVAALNLANKLGTERFDVLIVGRGGGSIEDLWAFNTEEVARAISRSVIPTISAVGHEVDFTIGDFVADLRAPTPSAAAELVVKNKKDIQEKILSFERHLVQLMQRKLALTRTHFLGLSKRLIDPKRRLQDLMLRCDELSSRLVSAVERYFQTSRMEISLLKERLGSPEKKIQACRHQFQVVDQRLKVSIDRLLEEKSNHFKRLAVQLNSLSPLAILDRGYSIVKKGQEIIKESSQVAKGDKVTIKLHKGELSSEIL